MRIILISLLLFVSATTSAQTALLFTLGTGGDDLRGGEDNVNVIIMMRSGSALRFDNVNEGRHLPNSTSYGLRRTLPANVVINDITSIQLETTFKPSMFGGGDNWNLDQFQVTAEVNGNRTTLINQRGTPLFRFTLNNKQKVFPVGGGPASPPTPLTGLMLDADFRRTDLPVGPLDNISRPPYSEPLTIPAKPFPGSIIGDFFAIRGNASFFTIGADAQDVVAQKFLLVPHLQAASTHLPYLDLISQPVTATIQRRQFRATLVFKAINEVADEIRFIINDPNEAIIQDGFGNGILSIWLQNGIIYAKTDDGTQNRRQIGRFQLNAQTQIEVNFSVLPASALQTVVTAGATTTRTDFRTPSQSWAATNGISRIAWQVKPPSYLAPRPARLQEFRLIAAYVQLL